MIRWAQGKKTYLVSLAMIVYGVLGYLLEGKPIDFQTLLEGLGLATLRAGISKTGNAK